jgi:ABC-type lipoprotein release transport system permease subunit
VATAIATVLIWAFYRAFSARFHDLQLVIDWTVLGFTFGFAVFTGVVFGTSPALHATRVAVSGVLKDSAASVVAARSRLQSGLVVAQIACTQPLLVGLGALVVVLLGEPAGTSSSLHDRIVSANFHTFAVPFEQRREVMRRLEERIAALPGVVGIAPEFNGWSMHEATVHPADRVVGIEYQDRFRVRAKPVAPGYFALFDMPILDGRNFASADTATGNPIIVSRDLAEQLWGPINPIGRRLANARDPRSDSLSLVVVGVVDDSKARPSHMTDHVLVYSPGVRTGRSLLIRTRGHAEPMIALIRSVAHKAAPNLPVDRAETLAAIEADTRAGQLKASSAAAGAGLLALLLSAIGLYAIVSFAVGQRAREIGIRTALGATRSDVIGLFFHRGLKLSLVGLVIGLPLSMVALRIISRWADIVTVSAPLLAAIIATFVMGIAALATWIPARRAAGVDPLSSLRAE